MMYVLGAILVIIVLFIVGVSYSQFQDSKKEKEKQLSLNERARQIQNAFRDLTGGLSNDGLVSPQVRHKYTSLASNFFVFQSINESNLTFLQSLTDLFATLMEVIGSTPASEDLITLLEQTADVIPSQARSFDSEFYANHAPKMLTELVRQVEALNNTGDEEDEQESQVPAEETDSEHEAEREKE